MEKGKEGERDGEGEGGGEREWSSDSRLFKTVDFQSGGEPIG